MNRFFTSFVMVWMACNWLAATPPQTLVTLDLSRPVNPGRFELVTPKGHWTQTYNDKDFSFIDFSTFSFSHLVGGPGSSYGGYYWDGFTFCTSGDSTNYQSAGSQSWVANQWGCMAGGGIATDSQGAVRRHENGTVIAQPGIPYLLGFWGFFAEAPGSHSLQTIFNDGKTYRAQGMYVANSPWPYYGNINGDGFARKLNREGDFFKLIVHGLDKELNANGKKVEHYLARFENGELHQSRNWEWIDLSPLGEVGGLYYTMASTDTDPVYGPNTAMYFCMDKLQVQRKASVQLKLNSVSQKLLFISKFTNDTIDTGDMKSGYSYTFEAYPGDYVLQAFASDGVTRNGSIDLTLSTDTLQSFQLFTITTGATNQGWQMGSDYSVHYRVTDKAGVERVSMPGQSTSANRMTILALNGDRYAIELKPGEARAAEGFMPFDFSAVATANATRTGACPMGYAYSVQVPAGARLMVGKKTAHFQQFTVVDPDSIVSADDARVHHFRLAASQVYNYRVSQPSKVTCAGTFTMNQTLAPLTITSDLLEGNPRRTDRNLNANSNYNVADIFLNINETGHLRLKQGDTHQLVNIRAWQAVDNIINNYFIEPDYRYEVISEAGVADAGVVTVDSNGLLKAVGAGTAIVKVSYDAINIKTAAGGPFFGALWPENTGVFVVTVGDVDSNLVTGMKLNEAANQATLQSKLAGTGIDAELDVLYYPETEGAFNYRFTPEAGAVVTLARPEVNEYMASYSGFGANGVIAHEDGSYTVQLVNGRNIVRIAKGETVSYQVVRAKPVSYTLTNTSNPGADLHPGDAVAIRFTSLYHPAHKLAGVYNMSARISYKAEGVTLTGAANQYTFASAENAQTLTATIPADWNPSQPYVLTNGALLASGYGDPYGGHRSITLENGKDVNFSAAMRTAFFGTLPDVVIPVKPALTTTVDGMQTSLVQVYPNPFADKLTINIGEYRKDELVVTLTDMMGQQVLTRTMDASSVQLNTHDLAKGMYLIRISTNANKTVYSQVILK